ATEIEEEQARFHEAKTRALAASANLVSQEVETELATLIKLLAPAGGEWSPIIEEVKVTAGYEQALGAALGDDLDAASDEKAPAHWRLVAHATADPELPDGSTPLSKFVKAPKVLARSLAQIGVVEPTQGGDLQSKLALGQRLVSKEGDLWRWDGYSVKAGAAGAAAARLVERSRLEALKAERSAAEERAKSVEDDLADAVRKLEAAAQKTKSLRHTAKDTHAELDRTRDAIAAAEHAAQAYSKQLGALAEAVARTRSAQDEARQHRVRIDAELAAFAPVSELEAALSEAQARAATSRSQAAKAEAA